MNRPKAYRKFAADFKREAVRLSQQPGKKVGQVAQDLGIPERSLALWRRRHAEHGDAAFGDGGRTVAQVQIRELERRLAEAIAERDILKKAAAWFAKQQL